MNTHRANCLAHARQHIDWGIRDWSTVLITESKVIISCDDRGIKFWRRESEQLSDDYIRESNRFGGPNVTVCGGISPSENSASNPTRRHCNSSVIH